jgi:hypothetical protein
MPIETPDDLAAFFDAAEFAEAAIYTPPDPPGGAGVAVTAIVSMPTRDAPLGKAGFAAQATTAQIRAAELPAGALAGGILAVVAGNFVVRAVRRDATGKIAVLDLDPA